MEKTEERSAEELAAGAHKLGFNFGEKKIRGQALCDLFERDPALLLELAHWKRLPELFQEDAAALGRFLRVPRIRSVLKRVKSEARSSARRGYRGRQASLGAHVERERASEYGL